MTATLPADEATAWLTLLHAPGLGPATARGLVARHASARAACAAGCTDTSLAPETRAALRAPDAAAIDLGLRWLEPPRHRLIASTDADFPALLRDVASAPAALFVAGNPDLLWSPQIAIVGARSATASGLADARSFARAFAQHGEVVTSGLAEGVDGAAHAAALDAGDVAASIARSRLSWHVTPSVSSPRTRRRRRAERSRIRRGSGLRGAASCVSWA